MIYINIQIKRLYILFTDKKIIHLIQNCEDDYIRESFNKYQNATRETAYKSDEPNDKMYCTSVKGKKRYINPLVSIDNKSYRIMDVSSQANKDINNFLDMKLHKYITQIYRF